MTPHYEYKCRRCGGINDSTRGGSREMAQECVIQVSMGGTVTKHGIPVSPTSMHTCEDGGYGITDFIGVAFREDK